MRFLLEVVLRALRALCAVSSAQMAADTLFVYEHQRITAGYHASDAVQSTLANGNLVFDCYSMVVDMVWRICSSRDVCPNDQHTASSSKIPPSLRRMKNGLGQVPDHDGDMAT